MSSLGFYPEHHILINAGKYLGSWVAISRKANGASIDCVQGDQNGDEILSEQQRIKTVGGDVVVIRFGMLTNVCDRTS